MRVIPLRYPLHKGYLIHRIVDDEDNSVAYVTATGKLAFEFDSDKTYMEQQLVEILEVGRKRGYE